MWTVKGIKRWDGMEGVGTECSLYRDGKKVARVLDDGNGGEVHFTWADRSSTGSTVEINILITRDHKEVPWTYKGTPEEKLLVEHANAITEDFHGKTLRKDAGWVVCDLCDAVEREKRLKGKTGFIVLENGDEHEYAMNHPYTPEIKAELEAKYGDKLVRILNTKFVDDDEVERLRKKRELSYLKRQCKTKTLYRLEGDAPGRYWIVKTPYSQKLADKIRVKYPDLVEIINETLAA